jgi:hypothetical protein
MSGEGRLKFMNLSRRKCDGEIRCRRQIEKIRGKERLKFMNLLLVREENVMEI